MFDIARPLPLPTNEPILSYAPGTPERTELKATLARMSGECPDVPHVIGGRPVNEGDALDVRSPHRHRHVVAKARHATPAVTQRAIDAALAAAPAWAAMPLEERLRIFSRAADLLAGPWRAILNAATMLGQSKTAYQAEIDSACELVDFWRFNVHYASRLAEQPISPPGVSNVLELRPLEGFIFAVTPFNFTAIAGNLASAPAMLGNVVVWKPSEEQSLAASIIQKIYEAAGLPPGVINVVYGNGAPIADVCLASPHLAGVHFTGSTRVFQTLWRGVGERIQSYRAYPRIVGETGGKDFVFAHPSADVEALAVALVRGAYEYQGQKCSAASRAYVPKSMWPALKERLASHIAQIKMGDVADFRNFMGAVIHERAYERLSGYRERAKKDANCTVVADAGWSRDEGWFVGPTLVETSDPRHALMQEELFGPFLTVHPYDERDVDAALRLVDTTSPYGLTGAIFAEDRVALAHAARALRQSAGNLYLNDKPTGAVVAQQPFGGARASGTNDKAGASYNLIRWVSPRVIKETFVPPRVVGYPFQGEA